MKTTKPVILVDTANLAFRFAHTFKGFKIITNNGLEIYTGIIYGILDTVVSLFEKYSFNSIFFVLEGTHENNPRRKDPIYKSKRATSFSIDITAEMTFLHYTFPLFGLPVVIPMKGEADDGIAFLSESIRNSGRNVIICSRDHDMKVLLKDNVKILNKDIEITKEDFFKEYKFHPKYFSMFMALTGDSSDNIPGINGIGPQKGMKIFNSLVEEHREINFANIANKLVNTYPTIVGNDIKDIESQLNRYYKLTCIRKNWPITVSMPMIPIEDDINKIFLSLKMMSMSRNIKQLMEIFNLNMENSVKVLCDINNARKTT